MSGKLPGVPVREFRKTLEDNGFKYDRYERYYDVSAHSEDEAEEKLKEDIANGRENPPEECYDSGAEVVGNGDDN